MMVVEMIINRDERTLLEDGLKLSELPCLS